MKDVAACLAGGFSSMPANLGAMHAWHQCGLRPPGYICASSAGGLVGAVSVQWDDSVFRKISDRMINLRKKDFASLNPTIRNRGILTIVATLSLFAPTSKIRNSYARGLASAGVALFSLWAQKKFVKDTLFSSESFLVYDNLKKLILHDFDFDKIFDSQIKLELLSVNINKAGWMLDNILSDPPLYLHGWKNKGWVSKTNFKPEDVNLEKSIRDLKFAEGIINGMRIWSIFDTGRTTDGDQLVDTAALTNIPVHAAINQGYDKIVLLYHNRRVEAPTPNEFKSLLQVTFRTNDITVSENTRKTILGYFRVNNDLAQSKKQLENLRRLEDLLSNIDLDSESRCSIEKILANIRDSYEKLSYFHKKEIHFIIPRSELLPKINFAKFDSNSMFDAINIGAQGLRKAISDIDRLQDAD